MPDINRPPLGFNTLLQLQTKGQNPNFLSNEVVPTIDYEKFIRTNLPYQTWGLNFVTQDTTDFSWETDSFVTVPPGELWYVHSMGIYTQVVISTVFQIALGIFETPGGSDCILSYMTGPAGTKAYGDTYTFPELFPATPGTTFGVFNNHQSAVANVDWRFQGLYYKYTL